MRACSSTSARAAERRSSRYRTIVACSAHTARCPALRSKRASDAVERSTAPELLRSRQPFVPELPGDPIKRAEHKPSNTERHEPRQKTNRGSVERPWAMRSKCDKHPVGRKQSVENGASDVCD